MVKNPARSKCRLALKLRFTIRTRSASPLSRQSQALTGPISPGKSARYRAKPATAPVR
jgi:hypothetical protein